MNRVLVLLPILFILINHHMSVNTCETCHPTKNTWFHRNALLPLIVAGTDSNIYSPASSIQQSPNERKIRFKHVIFRGDPREFLG
ncbi:unnamed protein product [Rotaria sordida]|uniref:Uncharacterized protein n=1 Tax=Rotaria sordida TaxID=392033 RepID=A0A814Q657_9BILA|nr:unnamed protein product [Rotaria sordida]